MMRAAFSADRHRLYGKLLSPLLVAGGIFYLTFHVLMGEHGVYALLKEQRKLEILNTDLTAIVVQRKDLEHRVRLMSGDSLDLDLLDEQSRIILNDARPDEVVIPLSNADSAVAASHGN